ncbi:MAG: 2-phospho-L-lactate guanylyltransferase [Acidobacteria bacterium]|nr:2-phospho-L-lactate guanylyltransferase [Acidobacteriota bacterium]
MKVVLLPVKDLANAKQRLAPLLSMEERGELARAMLQDVSQALSRSTTPDHIVVVTSDPWVIQYVNGLGWDVMQESQQISESDSIDRASSLLRRQGAKIVLRLPADIPLLQAEDVDLLFNAPLCSASAVLVPSRDRSGTNALLRTPPDIFPSRFGKNSFLLHHEEACRAGVNLTVIENPRIALDLDEASDLAEFWQRADGTLTLQRMSEMRAIERILQR